MKKVLFLISGILLVLSFEIFAQDLQIEDILSNPKKYDKQEIVFNAEVLDVLPRSKGSWFNVSQGKAAIGVWVPSDVDLPKISRKGSYKQQGDILDIKGVYFLNHEGFSEPIILAQTLSLIKPGFYKKETVSENKKTAGEILFVTFFILLIYKIGKRRHGK